METLVELEFRDASFSELIRLLRLDKQFSVEQFEASAKILDVRGFDSSRFLISRDGILMSVGDFPKL